MTNSPKWDLSSLYRLDSSERDHDLAELRRRRAAFGAYTDILRQRVPTKEEFAALIREMAALIALDANLSGFADLLFSEDTSNLKAQALMAASREESAELANEFLFFEIWWQKLAPDLADEFLASLPEFAYYLTRARALLPHTLSEGEEKVINLKDANGRYALVELYDSLVSRYVFDGTKIPGASQETLNGEELMVYVRSPKAETRAGAYQEFYRIYKNDGPILSQIYRALVRDYRQEQVRLRRYASPLHSRHMSNDLPPETVASLLRVCESEAPKVFGRYFQVKAKALGLNKLRRYDIYAPIGEDLGQWSFAEGLDLVLESFREFDPSWGRLAQAVVDNQRLDASSRPQKRRGAFCASLTPDQTPWVLMTYNGKTQDLFTLAHELGHAIHSQLAKEQNILQFHACLPLAESASTFGEMLLAKKLLSQSSPEVKKALTFHLLDDAYATVSRQAFFAMFEVKVHELIESGATTEEIAEAYYASLKEQFGENVELSPEFRWEWVSIPHFYHVPFYVYAYSFGQLLVYSLWRVYEREGPALVQKLTRLLARGGSA
ncbi:MAG: M3 family oligoendopeptidase, partial [Deltaproteobacteria bacterium]|nr:M3 family oligoendopeptidase [Deltaproteobacteria bacterium]